jgi:hypothetical protein
MQNLDLNPVAATAENSAQTTTNLTVAPPPPDSQAPPAGGEQDHEHDQEQETPPAPVERPQAQEPSASPPGPERSETMPIPTVALAPMPAQVPPVGGVPEQGRKAKPARPDAIVLSSVLGTLDILSEAEQAEYFACEEVVGTGWNAFYDVGLALARIRDGRLYRMDYDSFEAYCQAKWEYGRRYVDQLISAAQMVRQLRASSSQLKPDHETQVRPLIGLTPEQARLAWERAVQKAGGGRITARLVKKAVQELQLAGPAKPVATKDGPTKVERRRLIDDTIGQLLALVSQKADHSLMQQKIEALHGHIQALFAKPPSKA